MKKFNCLFYFFVLETIVYLLAFPLPGEVARQGEHLKLLREVGPVPPGLLCQFVHAVISLGEGTEDLEPQLVGEEGKHIQDLSAALIILKTPIRLLPGRYLRFSSLGDLFSDLFSMRCYISRFGQRNLRSCAPFAPLVLGSCSAYLPSNSLKHYNILQVVVKKIFLTLLRNIAVEIAVEKPSSSTFYTVDLTFNSY